MAFWGLPMRAAWWAKTQTNILSAFLHYIRALLAYKNIVIALTIG
jgi:hypothetical protein